VLLVKNTIMNLHYTPGAYSLSPHIATREAGIDIELKRVDFTAHTNDHDITI
jgi:glutathione S-transferase